MYQNGEFTVKHETPSSIGAALASLRPSYVPTLLRFGSHARVHGREVRAWNTVVAAVRAANPQAQFSVELNALQYATGRQLRHMMAVVRERVHPDGWLLDFYTPAARRKPRVTAAAVASAHANGEFLGGNAFGIARHPPIPAGTDYLAVQDSRFEIDLAAVQALARRTTVFFHLGNSPDNHYSDGCRFINRLTTARRIGYVTERAGQQAANGFRFGYPVFFPECERSRKHRNATIYTYNAPRDDGMMATIGSLMDRYEPLG